MKPTLLILIGSVMLVLVACSPAATPATAPAAPTAAAQKPAEPPAQAAPTAAPQQPSAAMPAPLPSPAAQATALPELKPPISGGVLNPPTPVATPRNNPANIAATPAAKWETYREATTGLVFQHPADWPIAVSRNNKDTVASLILRPPASAANISTTILIDVRQKQGDWLTWLNRQLPTGRLLIDAPALEGGATAYAAANAQLAGRPAVFVFAPAHAKINPVAALHVADDRYFYQFTYLGGANDTADQRVVYWQLLNTALLSTTTAAGVQLPTTTFTTGLELSTNK